MPALTAPAAQQMEHDARCSPPGEIDSYLEERLGQCGVLGRPLRGRVGCLPSELNDAMDTL